MAVAYSAGVLTTAAGGGVDVKVEGLDELNDALLALPKEVREEVLKEVMLEAAKLIEAEAKRRAPVRTGKLRDSIEIRTLKPTTTAPVRYSIGPRKVKYAPFVEYGTAKTRPKSFMRTTYDGKHDQVIEQSREGVIEGIERLAGKEGA